MGRTECELSSNSTLCVLSRDLSRFDHHSMSSFSNNVSCMGYSSSHGLYIASTFVCGEALFA